MTLLGVSGGPGERAVEALIARQRSKPRDTRQ